MQIIQLFLLFFFVKILYHSQIIAHFNFKTKGVNICLMKKISKNLVDTQKLAKDFLKNIQPQKKEATIIGLYGDLGTGKTTFVQALARQAGIKRKVNSPTFVIMKNYELRITNFKKLIHIDAYRLKFEIRNS